MKSCNALHALNARGWFPELVMLCYATLCYNYVVTESSENYHCFASHSRHQITSAAYCLKSVLGFLSWQCIRRHQYTDQSLIIQLQSVRCLYSHQRCRPVPFSAVRCLVTWPTRLLLQARVHSCRRRRMGLWPVTTERHPLLPSRVWASRCAGRAGGTSFDTFATCDAGVETVCRRVPRIH
jgi:hypothetical protein